MIHKKLHTIGVMIMLTCFSSSACAEKLKWYQHPGRWFKSVFLGVGEADQAPLEMGFNLAGEKVALSDYPDQLVLVTFWASWCGVCKRELPRIMAMNQGLDAGRYTHLAVNVLDGFEDFKSFAGSSSLALNYVFDKGGVVVERYSVSAIPHSVLIDTSTGKVVGVWKGENKVEEIRKRVTEALVSST